MYSRCIGYSKNNKKCRTRFKKSANKYFCCKLHEPINMEIFTEGCIMCSEKIPANEIVILRCKHAFHKNCLSEWFIYSTYNTLNCPLCRKELSIQPKKHNNFNIYYESTKLNLLLSNT